MDISNALIAKSDQLNAIDLIGAPSTVTIVNVEFVEGSEQPVKIFTDVFGQGRPFKPSKTVLRMLAGAWGRETTAWVGKRMALYREATVRWAGEEVGGIRIQGLSDIAKPIVFTLPTSKGKHAKSTVKPLAAPVQEPVRDWPSEIDATTTTAALTALYQQIRQIPGAYTDELKTAFTDRGAALKVTAAPEQTEGDAV